MNNRLRLLLLLVVAAAFVVLPGTALAQSKSLVWRNWDVYIVVQPNGDLSIAETQVIEFRGGTFTEGFREIPVSYTEGFSGFSVEEVDPPGQSGIVELPSFVTNTSTDGGSKMVTWQFSPARDEVRTFIVKYTVSGALRIYAEDPADFCAGGGSACDILSWFAIPERHDFPILSSHVKVTLPVGGGIVREPEAISPASVFWETSADNLSATYTISETLNPGSGVNVRVTFAHGAVTAAPPDWQTEADAQIAYEKNVKPIVDLVVGAVSVLLLIAAIGGVYLIWYLKGRDPQAGPVPEYLTEPPSDLTPGMVGTLLDEKVDMRDITASLIDLARRGYAVLEERQQEGSFGSTSRRFWFKKTAQDGLDDLKRYERDLFKAFFGRKDERSVSKTLPRGFYNKLPKIQEELYQETTDAGFFRDRPDKVRSRYVGWGIAILVLGFASVFCLAAVGLSYTGLAICPAFALGLFGLGLLIISRAMPVKTRAGAQEAAKWWAFRKYLENVDKYADIPAAADKFDAYLPYAVALNVDHKWVHIFSRVETTPVPRWYRPIWVGRGAAPWMRPAAGSSGRLSKPAMGPSASLGESVAGGLNRMGGGMVTGLNQMSEGLITALNTTGRTFSTPPAPPRSSYGGGGSSGWSGGGFGGGFSGGGFSGGGGGGGFR